MIKLSQLADILGGKLFGADATFARLSADTRSLLSGDLYVALTGEKFDGHIFVTEAMTKGAIGALVERELPVAISQVVVSDTLKKLGELAAWKRKQFSLPVLAVTGSTGKTTTKSLLASIMQQCGNVLTSVKSFNNDIGVPLTLWHLTAEHESIVLELGANHAGEIAYLIELVKPLACAVITNAGPCHLEGFGGLNGVARAKSEILAGLADDGVAILNADDNYCDYWRNEVVGKRVVTFGIKNTADVVATNIILDVQTKPSFTLTLQGKTTTVNLALFGEHNVMNALAAAAAAHAVGVDIDVIKRGLEAVAPIYMRLVPQLGYNGARIIDDTYNANPISTVAALRYLEAQSGRKIFVFGGMSELGNDEEAWHLHVGEEAGKLAIDDLYVCGKMRDVVAKGFARNAHVFARQEDLICALRQQLDKNTTVLIKGSRSTSMDVVVRELLIT